MAISALIFLVAPLVMQRLQGPGLIGLILAGAVIGPNGLNLLARNNTIILLGTVGLLYLMFMAGIEIDMHECRRYRHRSAIFGAITFLIPQSLGTVVMLGMGYDVRTSILIGSMFASHTLLAYPIAMRLGIGRSQAVTTAVGGTIVTDTAALLVLAIIAASTEGELDATFWIRLALGLAFFVAATLVLLPRVARWFFRSERTGAVAEYVFVFAALFVGAYLAELAGIEPIVGAFLVGLALNRLIPEQSVLSNRINFVGEAIFIPFFLLSVGMLADVRVLAAGPRALEVMIVMTATVMASKWLAAWTTGRLFSYESAQWWTIFGLSVPQAAATLAAALVGVEIGLIDDAVLNGTILMILVTCMVGPWVVEKYGRRMALHAERGPVAGGSAPQRILVPMANPATADALMDLALSMREPDSREPIYPLTVVPQHPDGTPINLALAEKMLSHAVAYASAVDIPVVPVTRVDHNFASGISRGVLETRTSMIIIGWDARRTTRHLIFGTVLDQLLEETKQHVIVTRLGHPLNTTSRILLLIPRGSDRIPGFLAMVRAMKLMANRLGASIEGYVVMGPPGVFERYFTSMRPDAPVRLSRLKDWDAAREKLETEVRRDDLVVLISARRGTISWHPALARLPAMLTDLAPESFLVIHPSETDPESSAISSSDQGSLALSASNVVVNLPRTDYREAIRSLLHTADDETRRRTTEVLGRFGEDTDEFTSEPMPGVVIPHLRLSGLDHTTIFLGTSLEGIDFPHTEAPACLIFLVLTPEEPPQEMLRQLAGVARIVNDPDRVEALRLAGTVSRAMSIVTEAII